MLKGESVWTSVPGRVVNPLEPEVEGRDRESKEYTFTSSISITGVEGRR